MSSIYIGPPEAAQKLTADLLADIDALAQGGEPLNATISRLGRAEFLLDGLEIRVSSAEAGHSKQRVMCMVQRRTASDVMGVSPPAAESGVSREAWGQLLSTAARFGDEQHASGFAMDSPDVDKMYPAVLMLGMFAGSRVRLEMEILDGAVPEARLREIADTLYSMAWTRFLPDGPRAGLRLHLGTVEGKERLLVLLTTSFAGVPERGSLAYRAMVERNADGSLQLLSSLSPFQEEGPYSLEENPPKSSAEAEVAAFGSEIEACLTGLVQA